MATTMTTSARHSDNSGEDIPGTDIAGGESDTDAVMALMAARTGHVLLESGHHGDLRLDLDGVFRRATEIDPLVERLAARLRPHHVDVVCGPLVGGALLAQLVAGRLGAAFCYTRRTSTGTGLYAATYRLPAALAALLPGKRTAIVDDVVNAGSAVRATLAEVAAAHGEVVAVGALLTLGARPAEIAAGAGVPLETLATRADVIWEPDRCPRCAAGEPLETPPVD